MSINISVAICTYNRADLLPDALESLCQQDLGPEQFEILVVDNASKDHTANVVKSLQDKHPEHHILYDYEAKQGLGIARNSALKTAEGKFIAYLDDDARADSDWLSTALRHFKNKNPPICLGGMIKPFYTSEKPSWFLDQYETRTWGTGERRLGKGESLSGSNMIWQKAALQAIGGFGEEFGVKGNKLSVGEETVAFRHLWHAYVNPYILYDPDLVVYHWVPPTKMKVSYYLKRAFVTGQAAADMDRKPGIWWRLRTLFRSGGAIIWRIASAIIHLPRYHHWQNWAVEQCAAAAYKLGTWSAACGIRVQVIQK